MDVKRTFDFLSRPLPAVRGFYAVLFYFIRSYDRGKIYRLFTEKSAGTDSTAQAGENKSSGQSRVRT
ncbi:MAG: hypothetical protein CW338_04370 [Clostridiales bacterium]|nr:hypothetical protein [Clostridiales bacterium]